MPLTTDVTKWPSFLILSLLSFLGLVYESQLASLPSVARSRCRQCYEDGHRRLHRHGYCTCDIVANMVVKIDIAVNVVSVAVVVGLPLPRSPDPSPWKGFAQVLCLGVYIVVRTFFVGVSS